MNDFEKEIASLLDSVKDTSPLLREAMLYAIGEGGKRIRPRLCFLTADFCDIPREKVLPLALSIECIHSYSLVHDDLPCMDNDVIRRGKPTVHVKYGEAMALLAGDALLNLAYETLFSSAEKDPELISSCRFIAKCAGAEGMVGGQAMEFDGTDINETSLLALDGKKTGKLIECSILSVAMLSFESEKISALSSFAKYAGLAFQLADDILDGDKNEPTNFVTVFGMEKTKQMLSQLQNKAEKVLSKWGEKSKNLVDFFHFLAFRTI